MTKLFLYCIVFSNIFFSCNRTQSNTEKILRENIAYELKRSVYYSWFMQGMKMPEMKVYNEVDSKIDIQKILKDSVLVFCFDYRMCMPCIENNLQNLYRLTQIFPLKKKIILMVYPENVKKVDYFNRMKELKIPIYRTIKPIWNKKLDIPDPCFIEVIDNRINKFYLAPRSNNELFNIFVKSLKDNTNISS